MATHTVKGTDMQGVFMQTHGQVHKIEANRVTKVESLVYVRTYVTPNLMCACWNYSKTVSADTEQTRDAFIV